MNKTLLHIESGILQLFETNGPVSLSINGHVFHFPGALRIEKVAGGAYYLTPLGWEFTLFGIKFRGTVFIYEDGNITGNLGEEITMYPAHQSEIKEVRAQKGKEVRISSAGIMECEVYDLTKGNLPREKILLQRDLNAQPGLSSKS